MALTVDEIMNRELFTLRPGDSARDALGYLVALGVTGAPVIDERGEPVGVVSIRDMLDVVRSTEVRDVMNTPAISVRESSTIEEAARIIGETGYHRLVVVDDATVATGIVSSLDIIRGLVGMPAQHPATFPHYDTETELIWTDDIPLHMDRVEAAPDGPGVFAIIRGGAGKHERITWAEGSPNVRARLIELLSHGAEGTLGELLGGRELRFRAARCHGEVGQERALAVLARAAAA